MDNLLYCKIAKLIKDPNTWIAFCQSVPKSVYLKHIRLIIPSKKKEFSKQKGKKNHIFWYELPNGWKHGIETHIAYIYKVNLRGYVAKYFTSKTIEWIDGKKHGNITRYDCRYDYTKNVLSIEGWEDGKRQGMSKTFNEFGEIVNQCDYINAKKNGEELIKTNGYTKITPYVNGLKHGMQIIENIFEVGTECWSLGKRHGERIISMKKTGNIVLHEIYENGNMIASIVDSISIKNTKKEELCWKDWEDWEQIKNNGGYL